MNSVLAAGDRNKAALYIHSLDNSFRFLADNPLSGQNYGFVKIGLRAFPHASHLICFRPFDGGITVVRILHQSMAIEDHVE